MKQTSQKQAHDTARDREMGRDGQPLGDLGEREKTWSPPTGTQGMSNRPDDEGGAANGAEPDGDEIDPADLDDGTNTPDYVAGGDKSNRAAHSGATGERHPGGGANKPEPKNQDEKGNAGPRNNTDRNR